jgi:hypothetical protein
MKPISPKIRAAAFRAQKRTQDDAQRIINQHTDASSQPTRGANVIRDTSQKLKLTFIGGMNDVGE